MAKYDFKKDLSFGEEKEMEFLNYFGGRVKKGDGRKEDLILENGDKLELKAERYYIFNEPPEYVVEKNPHKRWKTKSLYVEFEGNDGKEKGPFRAERDGCKYYVHFFLDGVCFVFDTVKLCDYLRAEGSQYKTYKVENKRGNSVWWVNGYLLPSWDVKTKGLGRILQLFDHENPQDIDQIMDNSEKTYKKFFS